MFSASSPKGQLKLNVTILVVFIILALYVTNCEARRDLHVHGSNKHCSSKLTSSPPKGVIDGGAAKANNTRSSSEIPVGSKMDASVVNKVVTTVAKKEVVASSGDSCRGSLRKAVEAIKVRSGIGERSVLGADGANSEEVGRSNTTAAYTTETLVAMDYIDAHPAPAVHNR